VNGTLSIQNRQRDVRVNPRLLRRMMETLLGDLLNQHDYELAIRLVSATEITRINETYLGHQGVTDVITFDYARPEAGGGLVGDIVICAAESVVQARRFHTPWPVELARYAVHGVLHLLGHDDRRARDRRRMKQLEDRLVRELGRRFDLEQLDAAR